MGTERWRSGPEDNGPVAYVHRCRHGPRAEGRAAVGAAVGKCEEGLPDAVEADAVAVDLDDADAALGRGVAEGKAYLAGGRAHAGVDAGTGSRKKPAALRQRTLSRHASGS